jgi:hypothetical protein
MTASAGLASGFVLIFVFAVLVVIVGTVGLLIKLLGMMLRGLTGGGTRMRTRSRRGTLSAAPRAAGARIRGRRGIAPNAGCLCRDRSEAGEPRRR